ncbi:MAG: hypothetical protein ACOYBJ_01700 [Patescibacteria group bacterium]
MGETETIPNPTSKQELGRETERHDRDALDVGSGESLRRFAQKAELETKASYEASLEKAIATLEGTPGIAKLEDLPTLIIPDLHGRREFLAEALTLGKQNGRSVLERLQSGELNVVCLGDGMHTEEARNWSFRSLMNTPGYEALTQHVQAYDRCLHEARKERQATGDYQHNAEEDYLRPAVRAAEAVAMPYVRAATDKLMEQELIRSLGLMKMVMELKATYPERFHFIRGNHDFINGGFTKYANESEDFRAAITTHFGADFVERFAHFEEQLPLMVTSPRFVASHTAPDAPLTRLEITTRTASASGVNPQVRKGLTWTDNTKGESSEAAVRQTLQNVGANPRTPWIIRHRQVSQNDGRFGTQFDGQLVQINNPKQWVVGLVPTGRAFEPDTDISVIGPKTPNS